MKVDSGLLAFYREWAQHRRELAVLRRGDFKVVLADDPKQVFAFERRLADDSVVAVFNGSAREARVSLEALRLEAEAGWRMNFQKSPVDTELLVPSHGWVVLQKP